VWRAWARRARALRAPASSPLGRLAYRPATDLSLFRVCGPRFQFALRGPGPIRRRAGRPAGPILKFALQATYLFRGPISRQLSVGRAADQSGPRTGPAVPAPIPDRRAGGNSSSSEWRGCESGRAGAPPARRLEFQADTSTQGRCQPGRAGRAAVAAHSAVGPGYGAPASVVGLQAVADSGRVQVTRKWAHFLLYNSQPLGAAGSFRVIGREGRPPCGGTLYPSLLTPDESFTFGSTGAGGPP
jgi:hypothetical protein